MDEQTAVSSPAVPTYNQETLDSMTPEQRTEWKTTGNLPKAEESSASTDQKPAEPEVKAEAAPESAPATQERPPKAKNAEDRKAELAAEIKDLLAQRHALRVEVEQPPKQDVKKLESSTTDEYKPLDEAQFFKDNPNADFNAFIRAEARNAAQFELKAERAAQEKTTREAETQRLNKELESSWKKKAEEATKKHSDFMDVVKVGAAQIPPGSLIDAFILDSPQGAELLYHLGTNQADLDKLLASPNGSFEQARILVKLEETLSKPAAPKKTISDAPGPVSEVGGKGTAPDDEMAEALRTRNMAAYKRIQNARELKAQKA